MPRVTHVKKAQQRYATKPVMDEATGQQKQVPMMKAGTGEQKVTKGGRPVFLKITERDLERPLLMPHCDAPACTDREIKVGMSYKWIEPSGQRVRNRHAACPTWNVWDYSSSLSARIAQIQDGGPDDFESVEDAQAWAQDKAQEIRDLAEEKAQSASNMEEGFGHETEQSAELAETAEQLESWADDLEGTDLPEYPEAEEDECEECSGTGHVSIEEDGGDDTCAECEGSGKHTPEEPTEEQVSEWRDAVQEALQSALDECPV